MGHVLNVLRKSAPSALCVGIRRVNSIRYVALLIGRVFEASKMFEGP